MTNRMVIGLKTGAVKIVPYTLAQEREKAKRESSWAKEVAFAKEATARITALVPQWTSHTMVRRNEELGLLDTPQKVLAARILSYSDRSRRKMRRLTRAQIDAISPSVADPFSDGGWPT